MRGYIDDDTHEYYDIDEIMSIEHLEPNYKYQQILMEINKCLDPQRILYFSFDYETMKLLFKQAREFNIQFEKSLELKALFILLNDNQEVIRKILIDEGYTNPEQIASIKDPVLYKRVFEMVKDDLDVKLVKEKRRTVIEKMLENPTIIDDLNNKQDEFMFDISYFYDDNEKKQYEPGENVKVYILDLLSQYIFDDYYINIKSNAKQIIKYDTLMYDRVREFYEGISTLDLKSTEDILDYYKEMKTLDLSVEHKANFEKLKKESYDLLARNCTEFTKKASFYSKELSNRFGCDIYYLDGEEFYSFVRTNVDVKKYKNKIDYEKQVVIQIPTPQPTKEEIARLSTSFTYIGKENVQTYQNPNEYLTLLYRGVTGANIKHVYHDDSESNSEITDCQSELHTPQTLLNETAKYPEIMIDDFTGIEPCAIMCLDRATEWDIEFSKRNNLPIVIINSAKYNRKHEKINYNGSFYKR